MKRAGLIVLAVLVTVFLAGADMATAIEPLPQESGFSGFIRPGVGYMNYKSNMVASFLGYKLSDRRIDSLDDSPDSRSNGIVLVPFSLEYTFASSRTQLFLGTDLTDLVRFDMAQQFGVKQDIGNLGIVQGGILFSGIPAEVWKDPYVVNQRRNKTDRDSAGARLVWDRIFNSNFQVQYTYRNIDISSEKSGDSLLASGDLTNQDLSLLERDSDHHAGEILYRFNFAKRHRLTPAFIYTYNNADGDAMKNDAYDFQLTYGYRGDPFTFTGNAFIGQADYDKRNPIYDKKQDDDRYGIQGALYYRNPWDWRLLGSNPMNFFISGAYARANANIDFYDQEVTMATAGVFFKW